MPTAAAKVARPKTAKTTAPKPPSALTSAGGRALTTAERQQDMKAFGTEISRTKESAVAFLKRAGIVDRSGVLAKPFR